MKIIIKFIIKNIREKKFRTFLIIISIMLSSALFFASVAITGTMEKMYIDRMRTSFGSADIIFYGGQKAPSRFFYESKLSQYKKDMEYIIGAVEGNGYYKPNKEETVQLSLKGFKLEDLDIMNPITLANSISNESFKGRKVIISRITAEKYSLKLNEMINIEIAGEKRRFQIFGIAEPIDLFREDGRRITAVVPRETLSSIYNSKGKVSIVYMKTKNPFERNNIIEKISKDHKRYTVREPITKSEINRYVSSITTPFMMMTTMVLFMSIFIIYTSFKVITMERLPVIGTFRSIGATKKMTDFVLFVESLLYGIVGGILGCGVGIGILYIMTYVMADNPWTGIRMKTSLEFTFGQLAFAFILAVVISIISSIIPIIKISKIPVKDIVLNKIEKKSKKRMWKLYLGLSFLIIALVAPRIISKEMALVVGSICMLLSGVAVVLLIPYMTNFFLKVFEKIYIYIFGNEGILAAKNLRDNKSILNNIALLSVGISTLLMINTVSYSVVTEVTSFYNDAEFEVWMWLYRADRKTNSQLQTVEGVKDVYGIFGASNVEIADSDDRIDILHGVNINKHLDYWNVNINKDDLKKLDQGRYILLANNLKDKFDARTGETIYLKTEKGKKGYEIIGSFYSLMQNGNYALISERYLKSDIGERYYDDIYIKTTGNPEDVQNAIKKKFGRFRPWVMTVEQLAENNKKSNAQMFTILKGFSILTLVIGIFGVLNNLIISFIERKRSLAIFRSIGMSNGQIIKMIFIEALTGGIIGGTIGVFAGYLMIYIVPVVMTAMDLSIPIHYSIKLFIYSMLAGMIIKVIASISPALKSSKLNIIESIKYE